MGDLQSCDPFTRLIIINMGVSWFIFYNEMCANISRENVKFENLLRIQEYLKHWLQMGRDIGLLHWGEF